jgi:hypothetical protein
VESAAASDAIFPAPKRELQVMASSSIDVTQHNVNVTCKEVVCEWPKRRTVLKIHLFSVVNVGLKWPGTMP